jgi:hypothetical protein
MHGCAADRPTAEQPRLLAAEAIGMGRGLSDMDWTSVRRFGAFCSLLRDDLDRRPNQRPDRSRRTDDASPDRFDPWRKALCSQAWARASLPGDRHGRDRRRRGSGLDGSWFDPVAAPHDAGCVDGLGPVARPRSCGGCGPSRKRAIPGLCSGSAALRSAPLRSNLHSRLESPDAGAAFLLEWPVPGSTALDRPVRACGEPALNSVRRHPYSSASKRCRPHCSGFWFCSSGRTPGFS